VLPCQRMQYDVLFGPTAGLPFGPLPARPGHSFNVAPDSPDLGVIALTSYRSA
jgi:hypothetical protein